MWGKSQMTWYQKVKKLRSYCDPMTLCMVLANETNYGAECKHTFARTLEFMAVEAPQKNIDKFLALLHSLDAYCDCQVLFKLPPMMEELIYDDDELGWNEEDGESYGFEEYILESYHIDQSSF